MKDLSNFDQIEKLKIWKQFQTWAKRTNHKLTTAKQNTEYSAMNREICRNLDLS